MDTIGQSQLKGTGFAVLDKLGAPLKGRIMVKSWSEGTSRCWEHCVRGGVDDAPAPSVLLRTDKMTLEDVSLLVLTRESEDGC